MPTGQRFGELIALRVAEKSESPNPKKRFWVCRCDCGNKHFTHGRQIVNRGKNDYPRVKPVG